MGLAWAGLAWAEDSRAHGERWCIGTRYTSLATSLNDTEPDADKPAEFILVCPVQLCSRIGGERVTLEP